MSRHPHTRLTRLKEGKIDFRVTKKFTSQARHTLTGPRVLTIEGSVEDNLDNDNDHQNSAANEPHDEKNRITNVARAQEADNADKDHDNGRDDVKSNKSSIRVGFQRQKGPVKALRGKKSEQSF